MASDMARWPKEISFLEFAKEVHGSRVHELDQFMDKIEARTREVVPPVLLEFPDDRDEEYAIRDLEDQRLLQNFANQVQQLMAEIVNLAMHVFGADLRGSKPGNWEELNNKLQDRIKEARKVGKQIHSWRNTLTRKHGSLTDRLESVESKLDEVAQFHVSLLREQGLAIRAATNGTIKLMLTMSAAMSATLATMLSSSAGLGAGYAFAVGSCFLLGLFSVTMGVGFVVRQRTVLKEELDASDGTVDSHIDPAVVAERLSLAEGRPLKWAKLQGIFLILQLVSFAFSMAIFLLGYVVAGNTTAAPGG